ncbi:unnamed protein product [Rotaria magnacalcarata]|uniref:Uncharacterized protein n=1 Tax=Rotaria magnacalcarata TaxID=392030 RepID=A0A816PHX1_9BILA|nr:unnamed protein product [Rotaria magnacalcarata]CAF3877924.1 unnamed protein product [Rotaria magnacalcarata]
MSLADKVNKDDDFHSLSPPTNSDDNISEYDYNVHRLCSRDTTCNKNIDQHSTTNDITSKKVSNNSKPVKGDLRPMENQPGHQQKYDGLRWRRICCAPSCSIYLMGGIYFENWLCRKHYLLILETDLSNESDNSIIQDKARVTSRKTNLQRASTRQPSKKIQHHIRGDIMTHADGTRRKYDGVSWRPVCKSNNCKSYLVARGFCRRHDVEDRKRTSKSLSSLNNTSKQNTIPKSQLERSVRPTKIKPRKGEIRSVRQQWNGTKWHSLCHYDAEDCQRRSAGAKSGYLCEKHFEEFKNKQKDQTSTNDHNAALLSPTIKRKKSINSDNIFSTHTVNQTYRSISHESSLSIASRKPIEQSIQTDVTYPLDSIDLRHGCILIEDDNDEQYQCDSPQLTVYIKKEEDECPTNTCRLGLDMNSMSFNCKLELTKLENS